VPLGSASNFTANLLMWIVAGTKRIEYRAGVVVGPNAQPGQLDIAAPMVFV
jgi:hypothetical protein